MLCDACGKQKKEVFIIQDEYNDKYYCCGKCFKEYLALWWDIEAVRGKWFDNTVTDW